MSKFESIKGNDLVEIKAMTKEGEKLLLGKVVSVSRKLFSVRLDNWVSWQQTFYKASGKVIGHRAIKSGGATVLRVVPAPTVEEQSCCKEKP